MTLRRSLVATHLASEVGVGTQQTRRAIVMAVLASPRLPSRPGLLPFSVPPEVEAADRAMELGIRSALHGGVILH